MYKVAVLGEYESIFGFAALGLDTYPVTLPEEASRILNRLCENGYGIIYITEVLAEGIKDEIEKYKNETIPAIIPIPGTYGNTGIGVESVKKTVEQAVGSDILFGDK